DHRPRQQGARGQGARDRAVDAVREAEEVRPLAGRDCRPPAPGPGLYDDPLAWGRSGRSHVASHLACSRLSPRRDARPAFMPATTAATVETSGVLGAPTAAEISVLTASPGRSTGLRPSSC